MRNPPKPVKVCMDKSIKLEKLDKFTMADTGGNPWDRQNRNYGKKDGDADDDPRGDPFDKFDY